MSDPIARVPTRVLQWLEDFALLKMNGQIVLNIQNGVVRKWERREFDGTTTRCEGS